MFNSFSFSELLTILLVIVIVFGPNRLPEMARRLGQWTTKARQSIETLRTEIGSEYKDVIDPLRDAREDIRGLRKELGDSARAVVSDLDDAAAGVREAVDPERRRLTTDDIAKGNAAGPTPARARPEDTPEASSAESAGDDEDGAS